MRWIIGDIHGMLRPLEGLLGAIERMDPDARFYFVGDYVNRGPDSKGVLARLMALDPSRARFVRGNHDDVFDMFLHGESYDRHPSAATPVAAFSWFIQYGLWSTLESYGVDYLDIEQASRRPTPESIGRLAMAIPPEHRAFIHGLPPVIEEPDFFVAHAMWSPEELDTDPGIAERLRGNSHSRHQIVWGRYAAEWQNPKRWTRTGYFGHTPVENYRPPGADSFSNVPLRGPHILLLDTAAALSPQGRLSAVCHETGQLIQVDRGGDRVAPDMNSR